MATVYNGRHLESWMVIVDKTDFISTHLLHRVYILNGERITVNLVL